MKRKIILGLLFLSLFCKLSYASISVSSFITADDVTVTHLETMRTTFQDAINSADGGLLQTATVTSAKLDANTNPENRWTEGFNDFVYTGLIPPTSSDLNSTTTAGTAYIDGVRVVKAATAHPYTASKHTYIDLSKTGTYTYTEVAINASEPTITADSIRLARVSTDTSKVLSVRDDRDSGTPINLSRPAFLVRPTASQENLVPSGTPTTVVFDTENFDNTSDFASNVFTAPITGKYQLAVYLYLSNVDSGASEYVVQLITSNRTYSMVIDPSGFSGDVTAFPITFSILADMDKTHTAYVGIYQVGGATQTDIVTNSWFSGYLAF